MFLLRFFLLFFALFPGYFLGLFTALLSYFLFLFLLRFVRLLRIIVGEGRSANGKSNQASSGTRILFICYSLLCDLYFALAGLPASYFA